MSTDEQWVKLPAIGGSVYVDALAELLAGQDIPYRIMNDWFTTSYGIHGTNAVGNSGHIKVPAEHYDVAFGIYQHLMATEWVELQPVYLENELQPILERLQRAELPFFVQQVLEDEMEENDASQPSSDCWQIFVPQPEQSRATRLIKETGSDSTAPKKT